MKKSKIALKPYLDTITKYCSSLSNEELTNMLVSLAKDVPTSGRVNFLEKIKSCLPDGRAVMVPDLSPVEKILDHIEALKESMEERIESIDLNPVMCSAERCVVADARIILAAANDSTPI